MTSNCFSLNLFFNRLSNSDVETFDLKKKFLFLKKIPKIFVNKIRKCLKKKKKKIVFLLFS